CPQGMEGRTRLYRLHERSLLRIGRLLTIVYSLDCFFYPSCFHHLATICMCHLYLFRSFSRRFSITVDSSVHVSSRDLSHR
ncbi:hypothetical protein BDW69DRAFT_174830, partial [Aspergillus filifer]